MCIYFVYISLPENEEIMLKNITLSAEEELIRKAKEVARREHTTLNANFQQWLKQYVIKNTKVVDFNKFTFTLTANNIFNAEYIESGFVQMPPSNVLFGLRYGF